MTLNKTAINCALQTLWAWRTLLSLILLIRFLPYAHPNDELETIKTPAPSSAPEKLNLKSLLGSSEAVQKLLQNKALLPFVSSEAASNPNELNKLMARLKPKQGRLDPALIDMLSNFENFGGGIPNIFGTGSSLESAESTSRRQPTSTEESAIVWSTTIKPDGDGDISGVSKRKVIPYVRNRFSSKYRNKTVEGSFNSSHDGDQEVPKLQHAPLLSESDVMVNETHGIPPFDHITDPNLRNHRLYAWEFEDYKNFTHIDREEDLMADESEPIPSQVQVAVAPTTSRPPQVLTTTLIPGGWIPKVGIPKARFPDFDESKPTSASDEYAIDSNDASLNNMIPGVYVKLPSDSDAPQPTTRPREPLRESSTENRILSYEDSSRRNDYRHRNKDHSDEVPPKNMRNDFRPSPPELSPPVFVDPDQDFFTSTIRNPSGEIHEEFDHVPGYRSPSKKRRKPLSRDRHKEDDSRKTRYETTSTRYLSSEEEYFKKRERDRLELNKDEKAVKPNRDVPPRPDSFDERDRFPPHLDQSDLKRPQTSQESHTNKEFHPFRKSDRILNQESDRKPSPSRTTLIKPKDPFSNEAQGTENRPYYHSPYGPASNEFEFSNSRHREKERDRSEDYHNDNSHYNTNNDYGTNTNNYPQTEYSNVDQGSYYNSNPEVYDHNHQEYSNAQQGQSNSGDHSNAPRDQYYAGGYEHQYNHPFAADSNAYAPSEYGIEESPSSWYSSYYILGGLVVASALLAFLVPTVLGSMGKRGKHRNDLDEDLQVAGDDFVDENTSTSPGSYGSASNTPESDSTADSDLWTEIKGVYNDIVNIVRGDYGGIVDKLTGNGGGVSLKGNKKDKNSNGPNIVYREVEEAEDDEKNDGNDLDAFENDNRRGKMRHRKGIISSSTSNSLGSSTSTTEKSHHKKNSKSKTLSSSINYTVRNNHGYLEETSRAVPSSTPKLNDSLAGFYLGRTLPSVGSSTSTTVYTYPYPTSTEGFMGEWAKVQLIGS